MTTDNLDETLPGQLLYVDQSALLGGTTAGISVAGTVITANYSSVYGQLAPGAIVRAALPRAAVSRTSRSARR